MTGQPEEAAGLAPVPDAAAVPQDPADAVDGVGYGATGVLAAPVGLLPQLPVGAAGEVYVVGVVGAAGEVPHPEVAGA